MYLETERWRNHSYERLEEEEKYAENATYSDAIAMTQLATVYFKKQTTEAIFLSVPRLV